VRVGADPERSLEPGAGADLGAAFQHHRPVAYIEDDSGFHGGIVHRDRGGVSEHDAPRRDRVGIAQQRAGVVAQETLERGEQIVDAVQDQARDLYRGRMGLRAVPRTTGSGTPADRDAAIRESEGPPLGERRGEPARRERGRSDHDRPGHGPPRPDRRHPGFREPREVGEGEDPRGLRADEHFPTLANQVRARAQLAQGARTGERRPGGRGVGVQEVQGVAHSRCTSSFRCSARPVGITRV
jgi:hypothetical protein